MPQEVELLPVRILASLTLSLVALAPGAALADGPRLALIKDIQDGPSSSNPGAAIITQLNGVVLNGVLFFPRRRRVHGIELWRTDGTSTGSALVRISIPGAASPIHREVAFNGAVFFIASDGASGIELWKTDGTEAGTVRVKDINPGPASAFSNVGTDFEVSGGQLFFAATNGVSGAELWKTDGTAAGTVLVKDINSGSADSMYLPFNVLTNVNGTLFFRATTPANGYELWKSDGTAGGTALVKDINVGTQQLAAGGFIR